ncbi:MAG: SH3 domain-containing protein [Sulfurimonas sp.]|nr:SH3 domain-containing protein [Sulfurimonas sp.]
MKYVFIILVTILLVGCSVKNTESIKNEISKEELKTKEIKKEVFVDENLTKVKTENDAIENFVYEIEQESIEIYDLVTIPQDVRYFLNNIPYEVFSYDIQKKYEKKYFNIWNIDSPKMSLKSVKWPFAVYRVGKSYGENLKLIKQNFFDEMMKNSNYKAYSTLNKKAVVLRNANIRAFPTNRPLLKDPLLAGEGFPFDYLQNSSISANKPLFISHYSKNREWVHVFSSFAFGWVKANELVIIDDKDSQQWQKAQQIKIIKEGVSIYDDTGEFLFKTKIGMMFALVSEDEDSYTALIASSQKGSEPLYNKSKISKAIASKDVLMLNRENLENIINEVAKTNYGWGGMYEQRDCSSMLRDLFAPFGIWLPRNSSQQSKIGKVISFKGMSDEEKVETIKNKAIPFETLLYKRGHIALYVGTYDDEIVIFHNTWGIKTTKDGVDGRIIIGRPVFSSLNLGSYQNYYNEESGILKNLKSMNILTR